jgi:hypothetical protein
MKLVILAASAFALVATPAFAGGWGGSDKPASPQFAHSSAFNYAVQVGAIKSHFSKGNVKQVAGAGAESINKASCGCEGKQVATAHSKNVSLQVATINSGYSFGSINQSAVSTSLAKNIRSSSNHH